MLVTIGCKVHLPTTMKLPFFIPLHKCLQHWHLGLLLGMGTVQSPASKTNKCFTSVGAVKAASTLCLARIVEMSFLTFASFFWAFVNLLGITWHKFHISTRVENLRLTSPNEISPLRPLCAFIVSAERAFGLPL